MIPASLSETIEMLKASNFDLRKATFSQPANATSGLQFYDLEAPAKQLIPIILPLLKSTPRSGGGFSTQANWQIITGQNTGLLTAGVPEGKRNQRIAFTTSRYNAVYKTLSMEGSATLQATLATQNYADVRGKARQMALNSLFVEQERIMFGGNTSLALGTSPTPTVTHAATGGSIVDAATYVRIVALSVEGLRQSSVAGGVGTTRSVSPADDSTSYTVNLGNAAISAEGSVTGMTGTTNTVTATWAKVAGAAGYAVFAGNATGAANQHLQTIVYSTTAVLTSISTSTQAANAAGLSTDNSQDQYVYDGMVTQIVNSFNGGSGAYFLSLNPTGVAAGTLTADGQGGVSELDTMFVDRFNNGKFTEFEIHVGGNQLNNLKSKIRKGSTVSPFMISVSDGKPDIVGGSSAVAYIHPLTGRTIPLILNPDVPDGMVFAKGTSLPAYFLQSNISAIWEVGERLSYLSVDWPLTTWEYKSAVVVDEVLKGYVPAANALLADIIIG